MSVRKAGSEAVGAMVRQCGMEQWDRRIMGKDSRKVGQWGSHEAVGQWGRRAVGSKIVGRR